MPAPIPFPDPPATRAPLTDAERAAAIDADSRHLLDILHRIDFAAMELQHAYHHILARPALHHRAESVRIAHTQLVDLYRLLATAAQHTAPAPQPRRTTLC